MTSTAAVSKEDLLVLSEDRTEGKVRLDGRVVVVVEENPSTGYHWTYEQGVGTEGRLDLLNEIFVPGRKMPGAPGVRVFLFEAARAGKALLMFRLYPPGQTEPVSHFACRIEIEKREN
jgi:predicted secreted protein